MGLVSIGCIGGLAGIVKAFSSANADPQPANGCDCKSAMFWHGGKGMLQFMLNGTRGSARGARSRPGLGRA